MNPSPIFKTSFHLAFSCVSCSLRFSKCWLLASGSDEFFVAQVAWTSTIKSYREQRSSVIGFSFGDIALCSTSGALVAVPTKICVSRRFTVFKKLEIQT